MDFDKIQQQVKYLRNELRNLKTSYKFRGNVKSYQYEAYNITKKARIFYDNPTQMPITILQPSDWQYCILGAYDSSNNSQLAFLEDGTDILMVFSTQPILKVENVE